jgi:serine/threonine-protein kinase HSL1 (negative regulator of Swe1 kinase)
MSRRSSRSTPSHRSVSMSTKQRSMSRSSLASSHWPSSPPVIARSSGGMGRRGVSFSHLRQRRSSAATASTGFDYSAMGYTSDENTPRPHTSIGSYGSSRQSSARYPSSGYRSRGTTSSEISRPKHRKPDSPSKYIQSEARKVSTELGKAMEEAFNRSSISSSVRTSDTGRHQDISQYESPPTSFSNTRDSGGSSIATPNAKAALAQRPLPPIPSETPNTFLQRKLAETRAEIARRLDEDGDNTDHFTEVLENLDRLMMPTTTGSKRTVSAPAKSPENAPLHMIPEEKFENGDGFGAYSPHYRAVTDPIRPQTQRATTEQQTIRLVDHSPTRVAPLNIRKRSGASNSSSNEAPSVPWTGPVSKSNSSVRPYQDVRDDLQAAGRIIDVAPAPEKKDMAVKKKKSLWFRRSAEEKDPENKENQVQVEKKKSNGLLQVPEAWQALDDRIKQDSALAPAPTVRVDFDGPKVTTKQSDGSSGGSEFPMRNNSASGNAAKGDNAMRKGFFAFFGKKTKEDRGKGPMELGGKKPQCVLLRNMLTSFKQST